MKALKIVGMIVGVLVILFITGMYIKSDMNITRSVTIDAPKGLVLSQIADLNAFAEWNPWNKLDSNMTKEITGEPGTIGHKYVWTSDKAGNGYMQIEDIDEDKVVYHLVFQEDEDMASTTTFTVSQAEAGVLVDWNMSGKVPMLMSFMMDGMVGASFEEGLTDFQSRILSMNAAPSFEIVEIDFPEHHYLMHRETIGMEAMGDFFSQHYGSMYGALAAAGTEMTSMPTALYWTWDMENNSTDLAAAIGIADPNFVLEGYEVYTVPACKMLKIDYFGAYEGVGAAHMAMEEYLIANQIAAGAPVVEEYANDPTGLEPSEIHTIVYYPIVEGE